MDKEVLNQLHKCQIELLDVIDNFCNKHDLKYYLTAGTLLGAIRHKGFIPWDDDIDIMMPREDFEFLEKNLQNEIGDKYFFQTASTDDAYAQDFAKLRKNNTLFLEKADANVKKRHHGIFLDIFIIDRFNNPESITSKIKLKLYRIINSYIACKRGNIPLSIPKKFLAIFPLKFLINIRRQLTKGEGEHCFVTDIGFFDKKCLDPPKKAKFEGKDYFIPNDYDYLLRLLYNDYMKMPPKSERITHFPLEISFNLFEDEK